MEDTAERKSDPRPYFIPACVIYEEMPDHVRRAMTGIVEPTYKELVLNAVGALARSAGISLTFLLTIELLEQFGMARLLTFQPDVSDDLVSDREKSIKRLLQVVAAKQQVANYMMRLRVVQAKSFSETLYRPVI